MNPPEYYDTETEQLFTVMFDALYTLNEEVDEWEPVKWDIINEDEVQAEHYAWVYAKLKRKVKDTVDNDPFTGLFK